MESQKILSALSNFGPLTGSELIEKTGIEAFPLWRFCRNSPETISEIAGRRFLRLDRAVKGYARLSPSIRREFQSYTIIGLKEHSREISEKAAGLAETAREISSRKFNLAHETMSLAVSSLEEREEVLEKACFFIAGDIAYGMAHYVPRPEQSTGKMVRGSDLDIVIITEEDLPADSAAALDSAIYRKKHYLIVHPHYREEIDYLIKNFSRVDKQLGFETFEDMVACKILHEGEFLYGNPSIYTRIKAMIETRDIPEKLARLERLAVKNREKAVSYLLSRDRAVEDGTFARLFFTTEEKEEIY